MSVDVTPNLSSIVMDAKDRLTGKPIGILRTPDYKHIIVDSISPSSIVGELNEIINYKTDKFEMMQQKGEHAIPEQVELRLLKRSRNTANAARLNGPTSLTSQKRRGEAAYFLTEALIGKEIIGNDLTVEQQKQNTERRSVYLHIGAALGHKASVKELSRIEKDSNK